MLKGVLSALLCSTVAFSASAGCLDVIPQTENDLAREIRVTKLQVQHSQEMLQIYQELANDAHRTANYSRGALVGGLTLAASPTLVGGTIVFLQGPVNVTLASYAAVTATPAVAGTTYSVLKFITDPQVVVSEEVKDFMSDIEEGRTKCSYREALNEVKKEHEHIMETTFDGSLKNNIADRLRLGGLSKNGTKKLLMLAEVEAAIYQAKLSELESLK